MINFIPSTTTFRKVPNQSGVFEIDLNVLFANHNNDVSFILSGNGRTFFTFGSNSGNYFASGNSKIFFDSTLPEVNQFYSFVIGDKLFDVYDQDDNPLILGASKPTGILQEVIVNTTNNTEGQFEIVLKGNKPAFIITSGLVFPTQQSYNTSIAVTNLTTTPFSILSGSFGPVPSVSGTNGFPLFIGSMSTTNINFSGKVSFDGVQQTSFTLNADFGNFSNVIGITGTLYSGSGYVFSTPTVSTIGFEDVSANIFSIRNTGTETITFQPLVSPVSRSITIGIPTYSGIPINNYLSGILDTTSDFFFSDHITWASGNFYIIHNSQSGINIVNVDADASPNILTDPFIGTSGGSNNFAFGQTFKMFNNFQMTGVTVPLGFDSGSNPFAVGDIAVVRIFRGTGISGTLLGTSNVIDNTLLSGYPTTSAFDFYFPSPISLISGTEYSMALSGNSTWLGTNNGKYIKIPTSTGFYVSGNKFSVDSASNVIMYGAASGNLVFSIKWMPPTGANRYFLNVVSGPRNISTIINSGNYEKYMAVQNFSFDNTITSLPGQLSYFTMFYTGAVSGLNIVNLQFLGTNYNNLISGFTT